VIAGRNVDHGAADALDAGIALVALPGGAEEQKMKPFLCIQMSLWPLPPKVQSMLPLRRTLERPRVPQAVWGCRRTRSRPCRRRERPRGSIAAEGGELEDDDAKLCLAVGNKARRKGRTAEGVLALVVISQ
jgi:hypothetical protein